MAAFIDDDMNDLHIKILVFIGSITYFHNFLWFQELRMKAKKELDEWEERSRRQ